MLATYLFDGPNGQPPCLIAHGLFGSARNWNVIAKRLSANRPVISVDMRNHGASPWYQSHSYEDLANDLAEVIHAQAGPMDVIGHSMGGKAAMVLALQHPEIVRRLVVADIAPVVYTHSQLGPLKAMRAVDLSRVQRRSDAASQLAQLGIEPALQSFFTQSLNVAEARWLYNLDALEREMDKIMGFPGIEMPSEHSIRGQQGYPFQGPTLFLTGAMSDYVTRDHRARIKSLFPVARFAKLPGAGHWLHADKPREFVAALEAFLG